MKKRKRNKSRNKKSSRVNRMYKDRLFKRCFSDKRDLLELYNALNGTHYDNPDELEVFTMEDCIYLSMRNDASFLIADWLNLYEQQSTYNPNMPVRGLSYFAKQYDAYIKLHKLNIYGSTLIELPTPRYVVFYNGTKEQPDFSELKLSDAFIAKSEEPPALECRAVMLNINLGHNEKLLGACKRLHDYSYLVNEVRTNTAKGYALEKAIRLAIDDCIKKDILADILTKQKSEVFDMLLTEYDEAETMQLFKRDGFDEGQKNGEERLNQLHQKLYETGRMDDLVKSFHDPCFRSKLYREFGL